MTKLFFWIHFPALALTLLTSLVAVAQSSTFPKTDSLRNQLRQSKHQDTAFARTQAELSYQLLYETGDFHRADSTARQAERLSRQLNYGPGVRRALTTQAGAQVLLNHSETALQILKQLLKDIERYRLPKKDQSRALANMGLTYRLMGRTKEALDATLKAAELETKYQILPRDENIRRTLGFLFRTSNQYAKAIAYYKEGIGVARQNANDQMLALLEVDLGSVYTDQQQYKQAIESYQNALTHSQKGNYLVAQSDALNGLANAYAALEQFAKALPYARRALAVSEAAEYKHNMATSQYTLGEALTGLRQYAAARKAYEQASVLAQEIGNLNNNVLYVGSLAKLAALQKNYQKAYAYQLKHKQLQDSLMSSEQKARTDELVARYEAEKKEQQIQLLNQQAQLRDKELATKYWQTNALLIGGILTVLLGASISAWLLNRSRLRRLEETQHLRQQIAHDLHDEVGSTLSSISMLSNHTNTLLRQNQPETAQKIIQKIYTDTRQILDSIDEIIWTINPGNDSLHRIALRLQEYALPLMESKGIEFQFTADASLDQVPVAMEIRRNLYLIGKEAINNLVKYSQATRATLHFERQQQQLKVVIQDNGKGFEPDRPGSRTGQQSIRERARAMGGLLEIRSAPEQGTQLVLTASL